ncbi:MAG: HPr family phosphocarrier protein [Oscillospiraceae bacterium]|nr:HPr family phosphocarrier protein [Oscillospiraceae bacterium]
MKSVNIKLATIEDAKNFVSVLAGNTVDLDLKSGKYTVDARSLMGIFALDWTKPVEFIINSEETAAVEAVLADIKTWIV